MAKANGRTKSPTSSDYFNEKTYSETIAGINIYVSELVKPGTVISGETTDSEVVEKNARIEGKIIDISRLKRVFHYAVNPKSKASFIKNIEKKFDEGKKKYIEHRKTGLVKAGRIKLQ